MTRTFRFASAATVLALSIFASTKFAKADSLTITYYTISSSDPDVNNLSSGLVSNEVKSMLGPNGLPVLNTSSAPGGCDPGGCTTLTKVPTNLIASTNEITYWDPSHNSYVTETSSSNVTLPFNVPSNFFPPNGTGSSDGGANGFQAATLTGTLNAPTDQSISFSIGSDDMAFVYLDGQLVCSDGGVHASGSVPCTTETISAGSHQLELFFVDINTVQSGLSFAITTQGVTTTASTPEPSTFMLLGTGLAGAAGVIRRRFVR